MGLFGRFDNIDRIGQRRFTNSDECEELYNEAIECLQNNRNEEAIAIFDKIIDKEPNNIHIINGKGSCQMQLGKLEEAEELFNQSLKIKENEMSYLNLAMIYAQKGNIESFIEYCDKTTKVNPKLNNVTQNLKNNYLKKNKGQ